MPRAVAAALALRLALLALARAPRHLAWRPEVSTPANSLLDWRECARLLRLGADPYFRGGGGARGGGSDSTNANAHGGGGAACHTPPLLVAALAPLAGAAGGASTAAGDFLAGLPNVALDCLSAWCLAGLARWVVASSRSPSSSPIKGAGRLAAWFLWNPYALVACVSASTTPWETAASLAAALGAASGRPALAGGAAAAAAYFGGPAAALLLVPLGLLIWRGPEPGLEVVGGGEEEGQDEGGRSGGKKSKTRAAATTSRSEGEEEEEQEGQDGGRGRGSSSSAAATALRQRRRRADGEEDQPKPKAQRSARGKGAAAATPTTPAPPAAGGWGRAAALRMLLYFTLWLAALFVLSDVSLRAHPRAQVLLPRLLKATPATSGDAAAAPPSSSSSSSWLSATWGFRLGATGVDLTPNLGLHWYLQAEVFEPFAAFFRFLLASHAALLSLPLAARFPTRPFFLLIAQLAAGAAFRPYPSSGDLAAWTSLLPVLAPQMRRLRTGLFMACSAALLLVALAPAMWRQWVELDAANPNFFYSVSLLHAGWQVLASVQLLLLTVAVEEEEEEEEDEG
jgi:hypothetical protein